MTTSELAARLHDHERLPRRARWLALLCAPVALLFAAELAQRLTVAADLRLSMPWEAHPPVHAPGRTHEERLRGDLVVMAGLPAYARRFAHVQHVTCTADHEGFRAVPGGADGPFDVWVTGASFFDSGTTDDRTFAAQLQAALPGRAVQNRALLGDSVASALRAVTSEEFERRPPKVLVWGGVQRLFTSNHFRAIAARLGGDGAPLRPPGATSPRERLLRYRDWHHALEGYLRTTSRPRQLAAAWSAWLPPMSIDHGRKSTSILAQVATDDGDVPFLFLDRAVRSADTPLSARGRELLLDGFDRVAARCAAAGVTLLVVFVPDKFELYRDRATFVSRPGVAREPAHERAATTLARELAARGVAAVDLYAPLRDAQRADTSTLLYYPDDTHWNDAGIRLAARHCAPIVEQLLTR